MDPRETGRARTLLQLRVGIFIVAGLVILVGLVYFLGRGAGLFQRQYRLVAGFAQIGGLIEGATVRLAGVPVGRVSAIRLPPPGATRVQVELSLARRVQDRVRADSTARIETLGLLGDKIVEVTVGSLSSPVLPEGAELKTEEPFDTNRLVKQGTELLQNLVTISGDLKGTIAKVTESTAGPDLAETVRSIRALTAEIEKGQGLLHRLVYDRQLGTAVADAAGAFRQITAAARRLEGLLGDPKTAGVLDEARATLTEARQAIDRVNRIAREVQEGQGLLHGLIYGESRLVQDLDGLLGRTGTLLAGVERGEGALGVLLRDQDTARAMRRVASAAEGLAQTVERAREADGLLKALVFDPEGKAVVADLRETARHFREVTERVARGEGLLGSLTQPGGEGAAQQAAAGLAGLGRLADSLAGDARLGDALADLQTAMANLRQITARIEAGEGTLGGLVADPTIYENLASFLEGAQRSVLLRALIRAAIGRGSAGEDSKR
jgi:phospholipid/cholesterol/gamma-HCH transport system substrate-binding protein